MSESAGMPPDGPERFPGSYAGNFAMSSSLLDAVALITAVRNEDTASVARVVRVMESYGVALELARILAYFADKLGASPEVWYDWCLKAAAAR